MTSPYLIYYPQGDRLPILASIPHSGLFVPETIRCNLSPSFQQYLPNQDWHLDKLYNFLPSLGVTVLQATYSRYVVDLNRSLKEPLFGNFWQSAVTETTAFNVPLYDHLPSRQEVEVRIQQYYQPYHQQLQHLINNFITEFGHVYLLDLHSFMGLITDEICLGNAKDKTCSQLFINQVEEAFNEVGFQVVKNKVFQGGYIVRHYGQSPAVEALQIEIRYPVYLSASELEQMKVPDWQVPDFDRAQSRIKNVFGQICQAITK